MTPESREFAFCMMEDRKGAEIGMRLGVLSVARCCPGSFIRLFRPGCTPEFKEWLRGFPFVQLVESRPSSAQGWDCKPSVMLTLFEDGFKEVVWLDSDLLVSNNCRFLFRSMKEDEIGVVEEQASSLFHGSDIRAGLWGFPIGRSLPVTTNSCVVRATRQHIPLLRRWKEALASETYQKWQGLPIEEKPVAFMGDQDVLCALLGSREFAHVPVRYFRRGVDALHSGGALAYTVSERLRGLFLPKPCFIHASGTKPWVALTKSSNLRGFFWWYRRILQETSPFVAEARSYQERVGEPCPWLEYRTFAGVLVRMAGFGHFGLRGLPLTVAARMIEAARKIRALFRPATSAFSKNPGG